MDDKERRRWEQNENHEFPFRLHMDRARREEANSTKLPAFTWIPDPRVAKAVAKIMAKLSKPVSEVIHG